MSNGIAHRIERLNAFVARTRTDRQHAPAFLIYRSRDRFVEADVSARGSARPRGRDGGFVIERTMDDAKGLCTGCTRQ